MPDDPKPAEASGPHNRPPSVAVAGRGAAAWLAAAAGAGLLIVLFYPGFVSSDSAEQWLQARSGQYTSVHPPIMAQLWSLTERIVPGPGGMFLLNSLLFWAGLAWLAQALFRRPGSQVAFVLLIGLWPPVLGTLAHVWKDIPMAAFALLALAALAWELQRPSRWRLGLAVLLFALACAHRHNALPLVLPFLLHIVIRAGVPGWPARLFASAALALLVFLLAGLPARHPDVSTRQVWPVTAIWDLAAVSIAENEMRVPADWRAPDLSVNELREAFQPWSNTTVFDTDKLLISLYRDPTPEQNASLRQAWLALWLEAPIPMLRHRLRLTRLLFGVPPGQVPAGLLMAPGWFQLAENPPLRPADSELRDRAVRVLQQVAGTPLYRGWPYLLALLTLIALAARRRRTAHPLFWPVACSVLLLCAPLPLLAPSAEFRYLFWLLLGTGIAFSLYPWSGPAANTTPSSIARSKP